MYSILGIFTIDVLTKGISLIPFMLLGLGVGMLCSRWINERVAKITVVILLIISGISLILTAV